ncbi:MAG: hypothetical protein ABGX90_04050 [Brachybacterium sp.]|uniref:hypothetical protein n=1 Tax=Brachybacterium sp. TaxID=1891286 RepID=UPI003242D3C9
MSGLTGAHLEPEAVALVDIEQVVADAGHPSGSRDDPSTGEGGPEIRPVTGRHIGPNDL